MMTFGIRIRFSFTKFFFFFFKSNALRIFDLEIFLKIFIKNDKIINFVDNFYIFHKNSIKIFLI